MSLVTALAATLSLAVSSADDLSDLKGADKADLQCMAVAVVAIGMSTDQRQRAGLASGATFYYGRLQGRTPGTDWLARFSAYIRTEPAAELEAHRQRCGEEIGVMGAAFTRAGEAMGS